MVGTTITGRCAVGALPAWRNVHDAPGKPLTGRATGMDSAADNLTSW